MLGLHNASREPAEGLRETEEMEASEGAQVQPLKTAFSEEEEALVVQPWSAMKKDAAETALKFFLRSVSL